MRVKFPKGAGEVTVTRADDTTHTYRAGAGGWAEVAERDAAAVTSALAGHSDDDTVPVKTEES
jgi:hypothetical protein